MQQPSLVDILQRTGDSPDDYYAEIQAAAGSRHVFRDAILDAWVVTGYGECSTLLASPDLERSRLALRPGGTAPDLVETVQGILNAQTMFTDGGESEARRRYWARLLRPDSVVAGSYDAAALAARCLDELADRDEVEIYAELLQPFVSRAVCERLGIDEARRRMLYPAILQYARFLDGKTGGGRDVERALLAIVALYSRLSAMPSGEEAEGYTDRHPFLADYALTIAAGHESTAYLLAGALLYLQRNGLRLDGVRSDARYLGALVREATRHDSPVQMIGRRARRSLTLNGETIGEGDRVFLHIGAANRDPSVYERPHVFDPERSGPPHLGFGIGRSRCPGVGLAVDEAVALLATLAARELRVVVDEERIEWDHGLAGRGFRSLPARLSRT